jgi:pyruvate dehydrogenase E2 component (dihydrolipoamide acetyltransferase)
MDIKLPELGDGIESGDVLSVLVKEGDTVEKDQGLIELETDKASMEIPSTAAGKVTKIHVKAGDTLKIGGVIVSLESSGSPEKTAPKPAADNGKEVAQSAPKKEAPAPKKAEPKSPADETTDEPEPKASPKKTEAPAVAAAKSNAAPPSADDADVEDEVEAESGGGGIVPAGPAMRRFAREVGVNLQTVTGTGPGGRITRSDILRVVRGANGGGKSSTATATKSPTKEATSDKLRPPPSPHAPGTPGRDDWGPIRVERMPKIRVTIANKMFESTSTIPSVTNFDDADVTELEHIRQSSKDDYASAGIKLTALPFVIKACAMALRANPSVNASVDMEKAEVIYKDYVNIGIAVDTERGLVVPSLRNADRQSIPELARSLANLTEKVRKQSFEIADLRGSTFTISNLGAIGGTYSTPIINPPEVAILLVGKARKMPVVVDHQFAVRLMMPLSLSYDHRLVDGAAAARFLNDVKSFLQSPSRLLLAP